MKQKIKERLKGSIQLAFHQVEGSRIYKKLLNLPSYIRISIFIILGLWSLLAILTPIPAGSITLTIAFAVLFGIKPVKKVFMRLLYFFRIPLLIQRYEERKYEKRKNMSLKIQK